MNYFELNKEEKQIAEDFDKGTLKGIKNFVREKKRYQQAAKATLQKTKNINIRLSHKDILKLRAKAAAYGMPYQTLIASAIHRYANRDGFGLHG